MKNLRKSGLLFSLVIVLLVLFAAGCGGNTNNEAQTNDQNSDNNAAVSEQTPEAPQQITIATASMGGAYYPIGVGIGEIVKKIGLESEVQITGGAVENPVLVGSGQSTLGITNANLAYFAYNGEGTYKDQKQENLRLLFSGIAPGTFHLITMNDSGINSYGDLKGKRVAVGPQGGGALVVLPQILSYYGLKFDDLKPTYLSFDEGVRALSDGQVDAAIVQAPHPAPAIKELAATNNKFKLVEIDKDTVAQIIKDHPYYNEVDVAPEVYGLPESVSTIGTTNLAVINSEVPEETVYNITKVIFENLDQLRQSHPGAKAITLEGAANGPIPLHPGAEKYYKEAGVLK